MPNYTYVIDRILGRQAFLGAVSLTTDLGKKL